MIRNVIPLLKSGSHCLLLAAALASAAPSAHADEFHLFPETPPGSTFANVHWADPPAPRVDFEQLQVQVARFDDSTWSELALARETTEAALLEPHPRPEKLFTTATSVWTAAAIGGGVLQGIGAPLQ